MSIIGNLIDNAVDATLAAPAPHQPVEFYLSDRNDELLIEVADQGAGLSPEIRPRIFEQGATTKPLSTLDDTGGEHGIGLYVVASYVRQAQGVIEISDNTPRGTVFSLFIPNSPSPTIISQER
jgi:two-component system cit operon sensor histidine kinase CitA